MSSSFSQGRSVWSSFARAVDCKQEEEEEEDDDVMMFEEKTKKISDF